MKLEEHIDLTEHISIDDFDLVMRAIVHVVIGSWSLALDDAGDRSTMIERMSVALGAVARDGKKAPKRRRSNP